MANLILKNKFSESYYGLKIGFCKTLHKSSAAGATQTSPYICVKIHTHVCIYICITYVKNSFVSLGLYASHESENFQ